MQDHEIIMQNPIKSHNNLNCKNMVLGFSYHIQVNKHKGQNVIAKCIRVLYCYCYCNSMHQITRLCTNSLYKKDYLGIKKLRTVIF